ncbi:MAG: hypothetical protein IKU94_00695 [Bacteroidaceae bacterium]|nr:hypothetical protein [Bacteroidaceae bacterium]MBR4930445.1 hypothetical protein [Bacteroidaceae bacterium]
MNLFDLFVRIGVKDEATKEFSGIGDKLKNTAVIAAKATAVGVGAATTAVGALTKAAVEGYAETEQLKGGIETLFKTSADSISKYADEAYKTAGLSANEYMSTVTSFSASLINSVNGDTAAAAEYANKAIVDMADNANKMGTDMSMIQNAYQGFAKQNYTMLDNLKLGYGGTKEEMQRLIEDANRVKEANGEMANLSIDSFADIVEAIHTVQSEMGITGATAQEAEGTISGSAAMMRSAWENLVVGLADENANVDELLANFLSAVETTAGNVLPVVERVLGSIFDTLKENGPEMIASGARLLGKLAAGALSAIPDIIKAIPDIVAAIVEGFSESGPDFMGIGKDIVQGLWEGIRSMAGWLGGKVTGFFGDLVSDAKDFLGIHSPSRVFAGIGENMALGVGEGWDSEYGSIQRDIESGLDFGAATVGVNASLAGRAAASDASERGDVVINLTNEVGGVAVARRQYRFNAAEAQRRGESLVMA